MEEGLKFKIWALDPYHAPFEGNLKLLTSPILNLDNGF